MTLKEFRKLVDRIDDNAPPYDDRIVTVVLSQPSICATPSVEVRWIGCGIDFDGYQVMIYTKEPIIKGRGC